MLNRELIHQLGSRSARVMHQMEITGTAVPGFVRIMGGLARQAAVAGEF